MTNEILALIVGYYELDNDVAKALCLRYNTHDRVQGERRTITMREQETLPEIIIRKTNDGMEWRFTIDDVNLAGFYAQGSLIQEEVTYNSQFMLETMLTIGAQIHQ